MAPSVVACPRASVPVSVAEALPATAPRPTKLFIGGIKRHTTTKQLREHFAKYGRVLDCVAMREADGRPRGFGYVTLDSPTAAENCLCEPQVIDDRVVDMKLAVPEGSTHAATSQIAPLEITAHKINSSIGASPMLVPPPSAWPNACFGTAPPWWAGGSMPHTFCGNALDVVDPFCAESLSARAAFQAQWANFAAGVPGALSAGAPEFVPSSQQQQQQPGADPLAPCRLEMNKGNRLESYWAEPMRVEPQRAEPKRMELPAALHRTELGPGLGLRDITNQCSSLANMRNDGTDDIKKVLRPKMMESSTSELVATLLPTLRPPTGASQRALATKVFAWEAAKYSNDENRPPPGLNVAHCARSSAGFNCDENRPPPGLNVAHCVRSSAGFNWAGSSEVPTSPASGVSSTVSGASDDGTRSSHVAFLDSTSEMQSPPGTDAVDAGFVFPRTPEADNICEVPPAEVRLAEEIPASLVEGETVLGGGLEACELAADASDDGASAGNGEPQGSLPSKGSALHSVGECRRCNFFAKGRCQNAQDCDFCHLPHERRKASRQEKRERRAAWLAQQGQPESEQSEHSAFSWEQFIQLPAATQQPQQLELGNHNPGPPGNTLLLQQALSTQPPQAPRGGDAGCRLWEDIDSDGVSGLLLPAPLASPASLGRLLPPGLPPPAAPPADWHLATSSMPSTIQCSLLTPLASAPLLSLAAFTPMAGVAGTVGPAVTRDATTQTEPLRALRCKPRAGRAAPALLAAPEHAGQLKACRRCA